MSEELKCLKLVLLLVDRCRCDLLIHTANELVSKHSRFLLSPVSIGLQALPAVPLRDVHADALSSHNPSCSGSLMSNTHFSASQLYGRGCVPSVCPRHALLLSRTQERRLSLLKGGIFRTFFVGRAFGS